MVTSRMLLQRAAALALVAALAAPTLVGAAPDSQGAERCDVRGNPMSSGTYRCITWSTATQSAEPGASVTLSYDCGGAYAVVDHSINFRGAPFSVTAHNWDDGQSVPTVTVQNISRNNAEGSAWMTGRCVTRNPV
jgi:hypothetical protein